MAAVRAVGQRGGAGLRGSVGERDGHLLAPLRTGPFPPPRLIINPIGTVLRYQVSISLDDLKRDAAQLSEIERAELALSLIESLEAWVDDGDVEEAWRLEIERRVDEVERGERELIPGDDVFAELRQRLA